MPIDKRDTECSSVNPGQVVEGRVRGSRHYADGTEVIQIKFSRPKHKHILPVRDYHRITIELRMFNKNYKAGIRMTERNPHIWICPNLEHQGIQVRLADVFKNAGIKKNDSVFFRVENKIFTLLTEKQSKD
jgi:hypothetical protein